MAELVDALVSGTSVRKYVQVRVLFWAPEVHKKPVGNNRFFYLSIAIIKTDEKFIPYERSELREVLFRARIKKQTGSIAGLPVSGFKFQVLQDITPFIDSLFKLPSFCINLNNTISSS